VPLFKFEDRFPLAAVRDLQTLLGLNAFLETGTGSGNTAGAAAGIFSRVYTTELHAETHRQAVESLRQYPNVVCLFGNSATTIKAMLQLVSSHAFVWLDSHYSGPGTACGDTECPVMAELAAIAASKSLDSIVVAVDDARFFVQTPPPPHKPEDRPTVEQICLTYSKPERQWLKIGDALFWVPLTPAVAVWLKNICLSLKAEIITHGKAV
jgi:hypothetical protein